MTTDPLEHLLSILSLKTLDHDLFRGESHEPMRKRVFGGQVIAQALIAAQNTVPEDRPIHSLHNYFLLPGDPKAPIDYAVSRVRDGGSFSTRHVEARQGERIIFSLTASFQKFEQGFEHACAMPLGIPDPDNLPGEEDLTDKSLVSGTRTLRDYWGRIRPIEFRPTSLAHYLTNNPLPPQQSVWVRVRGNVPGDRLLHEAILAYISDMTLLDTSLFPHGYGIFDPNILPASIDHAIWFHRPFDFSDWLLYYQDSPNACSGRGLSRGMLFTRDGRLVASTMQEGLIRYRRQKV